jgi:hypothetical protein
MPEFRYHSRRFARSKRAQTAQHLLAAFTLVTGGVTHLQHHEIGVLPILELLSGAAVIGGVVIEKVRHRLKRDGQHAHGAIGWAEIAGALMTYVEAFAKLHEPHHAILYVLWFVIPTMLLILGIFDVQLASYRRFVADEESLRQYGHFTHFLLRRQYRWDAMRTFRVLPNAIEVTGDGGRAQRIALRDVVERDDALAWLRERFAHHGIREATTTSATAARRP